MPILKGWKWCMDRQWQRDDSGPIVRPWIVRLTWSISTVRRWIWTVFVTSRFWRLDWANNTWASEVQISLQEGALCARSCSCGPESSACVTVRGEASWCLQVRSGVWKRHLIVQLYVAGLRKDVRLAPSSTSASNAPCCRSTLGVQSATNLGLVFSSLAGFFEQTLNAPLHCLHSEGYYLIGAEKKYASGENCTVAHLILGFADIFLSGGQDDDFWDKFCRNVIALVWWIKVEPPCSASLTLLIFLLNQKPKLTASGMFGSLFIPGCIAWI